MSSNATNSNAIYPCKECAIVVSRFSQLTCSLKIFCVKEIMKSPLYQIVNRVYIVNLPEAIERRQQIYERCLANNIEPTFFKAIRGNLIDRNDLKNFFTPQFAKFGGNSTLGVAASHVALWQKVANN